MSELLSSDRPITTRSEDVLGYWPFATAIAKGITVSPREGFVLGIQASWGMGKTSALNLIVGAIDELECNSPEHTKTVVARFNPWMFSGVEALATGYLNQIGSVIAETLSRTTLQKSTKLLKSVAKGGSEFLGGAAALGVIAASGGAAIPLAASIKSGVSGAVALATHLGDRKRLETLATELRAKLSALSRRIVIILDDLDRLDADELRQILTLVKTFGDLPNVVHILVYDRRILTRQLDTEPEPETYALPSFLEKIVQAEYDLPLPTRDGLVQLLSARIDPLFSDVEDDTNWSEAWSVAFNAYLKSPRDISRFSNALSVTWPSVAGEVYPPDLIAIELFRIFDRPLYRLIAENKDILVGLRSIWSESDRDAITNNIKQVTGQRRDVLDLLRRMFPRIEKGLGGFSTASNPKGHRKGRLIGSEVGFDSFFRFEPSPLQMSVSTVRALDERLEDKDFIANLLGEDSTIPPTAVLDELWELLNEREAASSNTLEGILQGLARVYLGEELSGRSFLGLDDRQRLSVILTSLLRKIPADELRVQLSGIVSNPRSYISGVGLLVAKLGVPYEAVYEGKNDAEDEPIVSENEFQALAMKVAARIKKLAATNSLLDKGELWVLFRIWAKFGKKGEAKAWLTNQLGEPAAAAAIIFSSMNITSHSGRAVYRRINRLPDKNTYNVDRLVEAAESHLAAKAYAGQDKEDIETFLKSVTQLRAGDVPDGF